jgi:hypothetical protein
VGERPLAAGGRLIEIEPVEFVFARWGDREIAVDRAVRCREDFLQDRPCLPIDRPIAPGLAGDLAGNFLLKLWRVKFFASK